MTGKARLIVEEKKRDYQLAFGSPAGQRVLRNLQVFCGATEVPYAPGDANGTMKLIGNFEVWQHISAQLNLTTEQLYAIWKKQNPGMAIGETDG